MPKNVCFTIKKQFLFGIKMALSHSVCFFEQKQSLRVFFTILVEIQNNVNKKF